MKRWIILATFALAAVACQERPEPFAPPPPDLQPQAAIIDPALANALATATDADTFELIVNFDPSVTAADALISAVLDLGAGVLAFTHLSMLGALATETQIVAIASLPGIEYIALNAREPLLLAEGLPTIRADRVHALGITGRGVGIGIVDSGIDGLYSPDVKFPAKTVQNVKMVGNLHEVFKFKGDTKPLRKASKIFVENVANTDNTSGHGTHVAGIAAGDGAASGGRYTGVAPGAHLIGIGAGEGLFIVILSALAGFDYILDHQAEFNIQVVNNSWGGTGRFDPRDPVSEATKKLHDSGIAVVFAGGNDGPDQNTMNRRSVAPWVISVAAGCKLVPDPTNSAAHCEDPTGAGRDPVLADFSSRGIPGDPLQHPDVTAPGVHIVSARASTGTTVNALTANHTHLCNVSTDNQPFYLCASGTSMAAPHVVGVIALMEEASGGKLTPDQALDVLMRTARPLPGYEFWEVGAGYVDAFAAVQAVLNGR